VGEVCDRTTTEGRQIVGLVQVGSAVTTGLFSADLTGSPFLWKRTFCLRIGVAGAVGVVVILGSLSGYWSVLLLWLGEDAEVAAAAVVAESEVVLGA
jgi:hypothetical protein